MLFSNQIRRNRTSHKVTLGSSKMMIVLCLYCLRYYNRKDLQSYNIHSPRKIISTAGKTGHDTRWKWKQSRKLFIHISNKSAPIKTKDVPIKSSKLFRFNLILFYSKYCKLKTFPAIISRVFIFIMNGPSTGCKVVSFVINVAHFKKKHWM